MTMTFRKMFASDYTARIPFSQQVFRPDVARAGISCIDKTGVLKLISLPKNCRGFSKRWSPDERRVKRAPRQIHLERGATVSVLMGLKLYCNRYAHFKDPIVCAIVCPYRTRCQDFALFYDDRRA